MLLSSSSSSVSLKYLFIAWKKVLLIFLLYNISCWSNWSHALSSLGLIKNQNSKQEWRRRQREKMKQLLLKFFSSISYTYPPSISSWSTSETLSLLNPLFQGVPYPPPPTKCFSIQGSLEKQTGRIPGKYLSLTPNYLKFTLHQRISWVEKD